MDDSRTQFCTARLLRCWRTAMFTLLALAASSPQATAFLPKTDYRCDRFPLRTLQWRTMQRPTLAPLLTALVLLAGTPPCNKQGPRC